MKKGLIIARFGQEALVELSDNQVLKSHLRKKHVSAVVGDWVEVAIPKDEQAVIEAIHDRRNVLRRADDYNKTKLLAANVDQMLIVIAPLPSPAQFLVDSYLVAAELEKIDPILVFNKCDTVLEDDQKEFQDFLKVYNNIGYDVIPMNAKDSSYVRKFDPFLAEKTSVFVGQSGVGKSTLIKALTHDDDITVGSLSETTGFGKHVTTVSRLYHIANEGKVIDSPGIREFGLGKLEVIDLAWAFKEFRPYLGECQFRNCTHAYEKGCAVEKAVLDGDISVKRWESYIQLLRKPV